METVARELGRRDIIPEFALPCALDQQISDEVAQMLLRSGDVLTSMQACRKFGPVVLMGNERVRLKHSFEARDRIASLVPDSGEMREMAGDLTFVPGDQDRFDV